ncbi:DUF839 domain-containing protein [Parahaliea maris]|uniref:DUF839 domain-containing protein n=1 Tax=Parahaliea maris TaxID=2716870 RepID=A0A5C8ZT67_9GAMM|nr:alkaline phosphatase PhoX [Parahaliea maris]TXS90772.1 DUF839 domain-containing protein [Parahaliea maris]
MIDRRHLLRQALATLALTPLAPHLRAADARSPTWLDLVHQATLPEGASLRVLARAGEQPHPGSDYVWHGAPDGGACFPHEDGGWVYACNSELPSGQGGAGALRFNAAGELIDAYRILGGTTDNCAGGASLWGSWLSCEENGESGLVYECDPWGEREARALPALGAFNHEAVAMDPATGDAYLTEDRPDGCLYRFRPQRPGDLSEGQLEVATLDGLQASWLPINDPGASSKALRYQQPGAARFRGGEGIVYHADHVYFTTKYDNRVWSLNLRNGYLSMIYDATLSASPVLTGVDNIAVSPNGELLVAEDGGDLQLVGLADNRVAVPLVTLHNQDRSEITGPAFSPDGSRLYFSSQRGYSGMLTDGITYELTLPEDLRFSRLL